MEPSSGNTALLLFTRRPEQEKHYKKLVQTGKGKNQNQLYKHLVHEAKQVGQKSGLAFFVISTTHQQGDTFGQRLQNTITSFFDKGYEKVIVIGNDCPELKSTDIKNVADLLQTNSVVLGPALDGGIYVLGLNKALFNQQSGFNEINWQTASVLQELQQWANKDSVIVLDQVYADLDSFSDLKKAFFAKILPNSFLALVRHYFQEKNNLFIYTINCYVNRLHQLKHFRGPPALF